MCRVVLALLLCWSVDVVRADDPARVRFVTTGWNTPTVQQFLRDVEIFRRQPVDGCAIHARADTKPPQPFSSAHTAGSWQDVSFATTATALDALDPKTTGNSYLIIKANPGDADWLDDETWADVVDHWRIAARLAKRGKLRGLLFDPEPYSKPFEQFNYVAQAGAAQHSFADYAQAARKRGRQVMNAVAGEFPKAEFFSYFLMSYLVNDHRYRGPSPIDKSERRQDFDWCLAGHNYGLLPAFLSGLLEASPADMKFVDGCEYGYWLTDVNQFVKLRNDVYFRGRLIVAADVRHKYDQQISVAFPVFVDIVHPSLIEDWTIDPQNPDRLSILHRQLSAAVTAGDGMVWLYGERGQWWPAATDTALWKNKDVYPHWQELIPGCVETIRQIRDTAKPKLMAWVKPDEMTFSIGAAMPIDTWQSWSKPETSGDVNIANDLTTIRRAKDSAALGFIEVSPGDRFRVSARVRQTGRGLTELVVRYRDADNQWLTGQDIDSFAYPPSGDPAEWRTMTTDALVPAGAAKLVVVLSAKKQTSIAEVAEFDHVQARRLKTVAAEDASP